MSHFIVFGNEKGGTGKSTLAMHVLVCLLRQGRTVGIVDLDSRQRSVSRFLENRARFGGAVPMPVAPSSGPEADEHRFEAALARLRGDVEFILIDCPGSHTPAARLAHALADTLVTPLNDSFVDLDVLGEAEPDDYRVVKLSHYAELVWDSRKYRSAGQLPPMDWVVTPNRIAMLSSRNNLRVDGALRALAKRLTFRHVPGLSERAIYRELFPRGLTMMDLDSVPGPGLTQVSHVAARYEVRDLVANLNLPVRRAEPAESRPAAPLGPPPAG